MKIFTNRKFKEEVENIMLERSREEQLRREVMELTRQVWKLRYRLDRIEGIDKEATTEIKDEAD